MENVWRDFRGALDMRNAAQSEGGEAELLNHFSGLCQQHLRDREAKGLRGLQVDHELERGRLDDRQVGRLRTLEDPVHVCGPLAGNVASVSPKDSNPPAFTKVSRWAMAGTLCWTASSAICGR